MMDSIYSYFLFLFLFLRLRIRVQYDITHNYHDHMIMHYIEYHRRFLNNDIILYVNSM